MRHVTAYRAKYIVLAALWAGMAGQTQAADYLRGVFEASPPPSPSAFISNEIDWSGVYGGVFTGGSSAKISPSSNGLALVNEALPYNILGDQLAVLIRFKDKTTSKFSGGAFLGYNVVWEDVVLGVEGDYSHANIQGKSNYSEGRRFSHPSNAARFYIGNADSQTQSTLKDWMTLRGRAGWAAGNFMPYLTAGLAVGNLKSASSTLLNLTEYENVAIAGCTVAPCPTTITHISGGSDRVGKLKHNGILYGAAFGAGVDFALTQNFFVRAEWQYLQFAPDKSRPDISINTARVAGAMKF